MIPISVIDVLNNIWPYLVAVLLFLILIIIHEFGHFSAAKLLGVKVNEFAVGFGPKLFSKRKGDTLYRVNLLPFGGYCAMEGENEESTDDNAFCNKKAWRRFIIVIMGALFNLILGVILVSFTVVPQKYYASTKIEEFKENNVSQSYGLKINDEIVSVNGRKIYTTYDLSYCFTNVSDGKVDMTVIRNGQKKNLKNVKFKTETEDNTEFIDVDFWVKPIKRTFVTAVSQTLKTTVSYCAVVWRSLIDLLSGRYGISAVSGPIGVTAVIGSVAKENLLMLLPIMALITVNLGIFNLLPLPALDGGRLLFILIEMITGKKVPERYETLVHTVGFAILLTFMLFITVKDITGLIK